MQNDEIKKIVAEILRLHSKHQVNLASEAARQEISNHIVEKLLETFKIRKFVSGRFSDPL
jgi:DNA-binding IscR family transcriptional regulator